jgi:mono/diheme cytochrome c family protein
MHARNETEPVERRWMIFALAVPLLLAASSLAGTPPGGKLERGKLLYLLSYAGCHGDEGTGDGPDGAIFDPPPTDLRRTDLIAIHSDDELAGSIREDRPKLRAQTSKPDRTAKTDALERFLRRIPSIRWEPVDAGRRIYLGRCSGCHGRYGHVEGAARPSSRDLSDPNFLSAFGDRELRVLARHGRPGMPAQFPPVTDSESGELAECIRLFSPGYELYYRYCVSCHGPHGVSERGDRSHTKRLAFSSAYSRNVGESELRENIWHMLRRVRPDMPHFESTLTTDDVKAILSYLRSLPSLFPDGQRENIPFRVTFLYGAPECGPKGPVVGEKNDLARDACRAPVFSLQG